ncbi:MAG: 2-dehydropantoate 2-reductase [Verrucomicrobia bacterium]|nr:2-dehydropantoate 2-reductase [Verrucomicrobiota bacterium]
MSDAVKRLSDIHKKKIGVVGCGAVGSYYGGRLAVSGHSVHFLLRSDYDDVKSRGVVVKSCAGDFSFTPACARAPEEIGPCDWVLVALKSTANQHLERLVKPLCDDRTVVLTLQNGLGNEEALAQFLPAHQITGGLCFVCINRVAPGVIHHMAHGRVTIGEMKRPATDRTLLISRLFKESGVPSSTTDNLAQAHWEKLAWNIPFNGLGVAGSAGWAAVNDGVLPPGASIERCLATDAILSDPRWQGIAVELMREVIGAANALGLSVSESWETRYLDQTRVMGAYRASTLIDFEEHRPLELNSLFEEPLRLARTAGYPTPRLEKLCRLLRQLEAAR